jgi:hypothetical protein
MVVNDYTQVYQTAGTFMTQHLKMMVPLPDLSSDDDTARRDSSSRETGAYLAPLRLPDFYSAKGLNRPLDIDDEESSTSAFSSVVGSDEEDGSDEDDMDEADDGVRYQFV